MRVDLDLAPHVAQTTHQLKLAALVSGLKNPCEVGWERMIQWGRAFRNRHVRTEDHRKHPLNLISIMTSWSFITAA